MVTNTKSAHGSLLGELLAALKVRIIHNFAISGTVRLSYLYTIQYKKKSIYLSKST